mmetsp:Transcript_122949/g.244617  ORF Transcript_122949/g.244617 Transcript_122949/m.244617 type:complete len:204 (-) Transcript_122949:188-799(-)|eukprot:CAMPEP_0172717136 /NCGR_PEP_ID=MMETSP1074-20121228/70477_1 /TAXON_ID=2916 /ORGANISM="Ceratium fusus, Strain PA161109" /LENGTH=203 /DNA_ID=CAMNT_0013542001 /DNA_START=117 /DNA_END=728 /DNA_ORIENTATION=+
MRLPQSLFPFIAAFWSKLAESVAVEQQLRGPKIADWQCALNARPKLLASAAAVKQFGSFHAQTDLTPKGMVPSVGPESLESMLKKGKDFVVVFYAPWCSFSQQLVLNGGVKAPLEKLNMVLKQMKGPPVVKYNIDEHGKAPGWQFQGLPTVILVTGKGVKKQEFPSNPLQLENLAAFALTKGGAVQYGGASLMAMLNFTQLAK